jgi:hypothetical protein
MMDNAVVACACVIQNQRGDGSFKQLESSFALAGDNLD